MSTATREAFFLEAQGGPRFCLLSSPANSPKGGLLYLHPFAEELNKSRRMAGLGVEAFVSEGWLVMQIDFFGCGDSAGDFAEAEWQSWLDDIELAWGWLAARCDSISPGLPKGLWTLRAGSLLAAEWLARRAEPTPLLMWQPVTNGKQHLTQFLRLKAASEMLLDSDAKEAMASIRACLQSGIAVEVAGYGVSAELAKRMDAATLKLPAVYSAPVCILEVVGGDRNEVSPAVSVLVAKWRASGVDISAHAVPGSAFWQTQEIETAPELIQQSLVALEHFV